MTRRLARHAIDPSPAHRSTERSESSHDEAQTGASAGLALAALGTLPPQERRGSGPLGTATLLSLQRTLGNRAVQRLVQERATPPRSSGARPRPTVARAAGRTDHAGLPGGLMAGVEALSGLPMDDVQVHYDSAKPAEVQALAYTEGTEVHVGPGQEQHLAHEAWHVVQQKQGRATADAHFKGRAIATDPSLEREADVMGEAAARLATSSLGLDGEPTPGRTGAGTPSGRVLRLAAPVVLQARWKDIDKIDQWNLIRPDPENALGELAKAMDSPLLPQYLGLGELFKVGGAELLSPIRSYLTVTMRDGEPHDTDALLMKVMGDVTAVMRPPMQSLQGGDDDENDHPEEDSPAVEEELITDPSHVNTAEMQDEPGLLEIIFRNIAAAQGFTDVTAGAFQEWYQSGVVTRNQFRQILERHRQPTVPSGFGRLIQTKRLPNTASFQAAYVSSNFGQFTNVTYTTDAKGNIDFTKPTNKGTWKNPVMPNSGVKLQKGATRKGYGILNNGVETKLYRAGRSRHNMIANRLRSDLAAAAASTYTWHHRTKEYGMELVDYMAHRKHGHNGGFLFWRDGM